MGYRLTSIGSSQIADKSLLPADLQDGPQAAQLLVTGQDKSWNYSPALSTAPAVVPVFALGGDPSRVTAPVVLIQLAAGGSGSLSEWRSAVGALLARLDAAGKLQSTRYILQVPSAGGPDLALLPITGGQSVLAVWHGLQINALRQSTPDYTPANIGAVGDYHVIIPLNQASKVGVGIRAKTGQTGDLQQWQDSAGAILARISAGGVLFGNGSGLTNVPVSTHTHPGSDITSQVASALAADAVPWTGISGKPATFPPAAHTHAGSEITDNSMPGSKLQDASVPFAKLQVDQNVFTNLSTAGQPINGGAAFTPGTYAVRIQVPDSSACVFTLSVMAQPGLRGFAVQNLHGATLSIGVIPGVHTYQFTGFADGRQYQLEVHQATGLAFAKMGTGTATGQTIYSFRKLI
ncbi:hypothetical protein QQ056_07335 [Oscillatoria laete-virens NRMC-F 0139]|nr:hypothetical protein [Oscillatoria laete-virens]MDL5053356.1 hypothetical protein [Oscillatoria laete-virens NRMC-F 0139]